MDNYFSLFQLPTQFALSVPDLQDKWKILSATVHPDRYATASDTEKRLAMQWATQINQAYQTLKDPIARASYICEQQGFQVNAENNTAMPMEFLMEQMQWREDIESAHNNPSALEQLKQSIQSTQASLFQRIEQALDQQQDYAQAVGLIRQAMFYHKLLTEF